MKTITIENLIPSELLIYKNSVLVATVDTSAITEYDYTLENGVYLFDNEGNKDACFYLDDETKCKLYSKLCYDNLYYYYTALTLIEHCSNKYEEAVEIYNHFIKKLEDDCECVHTSCL